MKKSRTKRGAKSFAWRFTPLADAIMMDRISALARTAGRALPEKTIRGFAGDKLARTRTALRKHGVSASFALSIVPIAPAPVVGMVAGAAHLQVRQFLLGTMLGMLPGVLATTLFADQVAKVLDDAEQINWWIVGGVVLGFAAMTLLVRAWIRRRMLP